MKGWTGVLTRMIAMASYQESETVSEFTGNEAAYDLQQASEYEVSLRYHNFERKKDDSTIVLIELSGTDGNIKPPVHLHF